MKERKEEKAKWKQELKDMKERMDREISISQEKAKKSLNMLKNTYKGEQESEVVDLEECKDCKDKDAKIDSLE